MILVTITHKMDRAIAKPIPFKIIPDTNHTGIKPLTRLLQMQQLCLRRFQNKIPQKNTRL